MTRADWSYIMKTVSAASSEESLTQQRLSAQCSVLYFSATTDHDSTPIADYKSPRCRTVVQKHLSGVTDPGERTNERTNERSCTLKLSEEALVGDSD